MISSFHHQVEAVKQENASLKLTIEDMETRWKAAFHTANQRIEASLRTTRQEFKRDLDDKIREIQESTAFKEKQLMLLAHRLHR